MNNGLQEALDSILGPAAAAAAGLIATLAMGVVPVALYFAALALITRIHHRGG